MTFSEDVENVDATDFEVSGTTATPTAVSEVTASTVYDVTVSGGNLADRNALVTLAFAAGRNIVDTVGNALSNTTPTGTNDNDYAVDNTKPTVTIAGVPMTSTAAFTATITFLESVNGFVVGDITVGNGTASSFTGSDGDTAFTALISPTANGPVTVDVAAGVATDAAGNGNTAATQAASTYTAPLVDNTAPRVTSIARQTPASSPTNAEQPDLAGDLQRGRGGTWMQTDFEVSRHDGDADGGQRGNGLDGLRRDGQRGQPGGPQRHGDAHVRRGPEHRRSGRQRAIEHHADGGDRQRLCRRQREADGDDHRGSDDEHGRLHGDDHLPGAGERVRGG